MRRFEVVIWTKTTQLPVQVGGGLRSINKDELQLPASAPPSKLPEPVSSSRGLPRNSTNCQLPENKSVFITQIFRPALDNRLGQKQ